MDLNKLATLFETLGGRIENHRDYISGSELVTRIMLIDPVLEMLGWNVQDPDLVRLEYQSAETNRRKADYVLRCQDKDIAVVEAKALGIRELDSVANREQADSYARYAETEYFVLTDGQEWILHKPGRTSPERLAPIVKFSIAEEHPFQCALKALTICQPNLISTSTSGPIAAREPVFKIDPTGDTRTNPSYSLATNSLTETSMVSTPPHTSTDPEDPSIPPSLNEEHPNSRTHINLEASSVWTSLDSLINIPITAKTHKIKGIRFHDGYTDNATTWTDALRCVAHWLVRTHRLNHSNAQINTSRHGRRLLSSHSPHHPDGKEFTRSTKISDGVFIETNWNPQGCVERIAQLLNHCGVGLGRLSIKIEYRGTDLPLPSASTIMSTVAPSTYPALPQEQPSRQKYDGWLSIVDQSWNPTGMRPNAVMIRDDVHHINPPRWSAFCRYIGDWLVESGKLRPEDCPVFVTSSQNICFINTSRIHPNGRPFHLAASLPKGMYIDVGLSARQQLRNIATLLERYRIDPKQVFVRVE